MADTNFDFDELDKAVNELMTGVDTSQRNTSLDDPEDKVVSLDATAANVAAAPAPAPTTAPAPQPTPTVQPVAPAPAPAATPSLAVKRRGQFMDMVHPSSDMKTTKMSVGRQGVTVQPRPSATAPTPAPAPAVQPVAPESPVVSQAAPEPTFSLDTEPPTNFTPAEPAVSSTEPVAPEVTSEVSAPEPSVTPDFAGFEAPQSNPETPGITVEPVVAEAEPQPEPEQPAEEPLPTPMSSPFLPDAVVEKRPLGAHADTPAVAEESAKPDEDDGAPDGPPELPPAPEALPEELTSDLVSIESGAQPRSVAAEQSTNTEGVSAEESAPTPAGPTSIPQQYTEQPSTSDQTTTPIYDTANYPDVAQPAKPAKKSSALKWILWIVLLIVIGVGAGVAYYFLNH